MAGNEGFSMLLQHISNGMPSTTCSRVEKRKNQIWFSFWLSFLKVLKQINRSRKEI
jgi:hypothetical protein